MKPEDFIKQNTSQQWESKSVNIDIKDIAHLMREYATQLLSDYTDKIVENAEKWRDLSDGHYKKVDKKSITNQLELFLKDLL